MASLCLSFFIRQIIFLTWQTSREAEPKSTARWTRHGNSSCLTEKQNLPRKLLIHIGRGSYSFLASAVHHNFCMSSCIFCMGPFGTVDALPRRIALATGLRRRRALTQKITRAAVQTTRLQPWFTRLCKQKLHILSRSSTTEIPCFGTCDNSKLSKN